MSKKSYKSFYKPIRVIFRTICALCAIGQFTWPISAKNDCTAKYAGGGGGGTHREQVQLQGVCRSSRPRLVGVRDCINGRFTDPLFRIWSDPDPVWTSRSRFEISLKFNFTSSICWPNWYIYHTALEYKLYWLLCKDNTVNRLNISVGFFSDR